MGSVYCVIDVASAMCLDSIVIRLFKLNFLF